MKTKLTEKHCVPCEGGMAPHSRDEAEKNIAEVDARWQLRGDAKMISAEFAFGNFKEALQFVNKVGDVAEEEKHHPDIRIFAYKKVLIELSTHAIGGLSENDFILAAKIDGLV